MIDRDTAPHRQDSAVLQSNQGFRKACKQQADMHSPAAAESKDKNKGGRGGIAGAPTTAHRQAQGRHKSRYNMP